MAEELVQRRLAGILAADVVGYSRLMEQDEAGTLAALTARRRQLLDPKIAEHGGRVFKTMGDGLLIEFTSSVSAVQCAVELQQAMMLANADLPEQKRMALRIGVNVGDVLVQDGDMFGDSVNVAARLEGLAEPGGICIAANVYEQVKNKLKVKFDDLGFQTVKNITEPVHVYCVRSDRSAVDTGYVTCNARLTLPAKPSIAVLPFDNMSGDSEQTYFSDGITEDIISELSRFRSLFVIARNSSFQYRGKIIDVSRIGRDLGVAYLVEGSVRKISQRIRITAQLIEAATGIHVWGDRFDFDLTEIFTIQDEMVQTIASRLADRVENEEWHRTKRSPPQDMRAYELCLQGWRSVYLMTAAATNEARTIFLKSIDIDPMYGRAYSGLAWVFEALASYSMYSDHTTSTSDCRETAVQYALKAVELDDTDNKAHVILGWTYHFRREYELSRRHLERALELNPNDADGLILRAMLLTLQGESALGIACAEKAIRLNPYHPGYYLGALAAGHFFSGRYLEAARLREKIAHGFPEHLAGLAAAYALAGDQKKASEALARFLASASAYWKEPPTARSMADIFVFKRSEDEALYVEGLRQAGLPE
jgi:TolB-like protein